jgi:hypothetical protein
MLHSSMSDVFVRLAETIAEPTWQKIGLSLKSYSVRRTIKPPEEELICDGQMLRIVAIS